MQIPDTLLAAKLPPAAKTVLTALWSRAEGDPAWTAPRVTELAERVAMSLQHVKRQLALLTALGAIRREARDAHGRRLRGFGLSRRITPLRPPVSRRAPATPAGETQGVVKRERAHKLTLRDDMLAIARVAGRGDSEEHIARVLIAGGVPCSSVVWYGVKVHRRIALMADELGITTPGARAGDIVAKWRVTAERDEKRKAAAREAATPDAKMDFSTNGDW